MQKILRIALCQMLATPNKEHNLAKASELIGAAVAKGAQLVVLPECFNSPYGTKFMPSYAEEVTLDAPTPRMLAAEAAKHRIWLVGGSIPEVEPSTSRVFNTSLTYDPEGKLRWKFRKVHLFKIDTEEVKVDEHEVLTAGNNPGVLEIAPGWTMGVGICFDVRYPQLAHRLVEKGANLLVYPGAFNMVTGPAHWQLSGRARAVDTQSYVALCSAGRDTTADYVAWGHSCIVNPWGDVMSEAGHGEEIIVSDLDRDFVTATRTRLPILSGIRTDLYQTVWKE